jgi:hypothetical protein
MRLFEISGQFKEVEALLDSDEVPHQVILDTLEGIQGAFEVKAVAVAQMVLALANRAQAVADASKRMGERADRIQKRADSLKAYLLMQMQIMQCERIESDELVVRRQANPASVYVMNEASVPAAYWRQAPAPPPELDKMLIKAALQNGEDVPGCFVEKGEHVRISL